MESLFCIRSRQDVGDDDDKNSFIRVDAAHTEASFQIGFVISGIFNIINITIFFIDSCSFFDAGCAEEFEYAEFDSYFNIYYSNHECINLYSFSSPELGNSC